MSSETLSAARHRVAPTRSGFRNQQIALATLFPALHPGGLYAIEDLHWQPRSGRKLAPSTKTVLADFLKTGKVRSAILTEQECEYLSSEISQCTFCHTGQHSSEALCVLTKTRRDRPLA